MSDNSFTAWWLDKGDTGQTLEKRTISEADLMEGDVTVDVAYSTVNYKDGLALTGKAPIARRYPMIPGIDFAGTVRASNHAAFKAGDAVILNGYGLGETHMGGYAGRARVNGDWLLKLPKGLSMQQAMAIGTAGYTAMLCVMRLEDAGVTPDAGDVLVTGAAGGVGSVAIALLADKGYRVVASTGRMSETDYLKSLGAADVIDRAELSSPGKPFAKPRWAAAVDSVGSVTLANVLAQIHYGGAVAACGLAQGSDLPTTVLPFILRGVSLLGVDSVMAPMARRQAAWARLATDLDLKKLDTITETIGFDDLPKAAERIVAGGVRGRLVVTI